MFTRILLAALLLSAPLAFGTAAVAKERSAADKALLAKAQKDCNNPGRYVNGARIQINYAKGTYRCIEIQSSHG